MVEGVSFRISPGGATVCWHVLLRRKAWPGYSAQIDSASGRGPQSSALSGGVSPVAAPRPRGGVRKPVRIALLDRTAMHSMRYSSHLQN